jgi:hypothetical protein
MSDIVIDWAGFSGGEDNRTQIKRNHVIRSAGVCDPYGKYHKRMMHVDLCKWRDNIIDYYNTPNHITPPNLIRPDIMKYNVFDDDGNQYPRIHGLSKVDIEDMYPPLFSNSFGEPKESIIVDLDFFHTLLMFINTPKSIAARDHMRACRQLHDLYILYQSIHSEIQTQEVGKFNIKEE